MSSASGKFYAMMQQDGRPSEGADLLQVADSALPRLAAGSWAHDVPTGDWAAYFTSLRRPRTLVDYSLEAMNITSQRRINATLIGAYFASYLPESECDRWIRLPRWKVATAGIQVALGVLAYLTASQRLEISRQFVLTLILGGAVLWNCRA